MRIVQLIDSLNAGGAERIAVNYANGLAHKVEFSGIVATRKEGELKAAVHPEVGYLFLNRKKTLDIRAVLTLKKWILCNKIDIIHAHGPSFFMAILVKCLHPGIRIVWHEHYGARAGQTRSANMILYFCSLFFSAVFVVNRQLESWMNRNLLSRNVSCVPNFISATPAIRQVTILNGVPGKRILLVANLKQPKNHIAALRAFESLKLCDEGWSLHFIGENYGDAYFGEIARFIEEHQLASSVWLHGSRPDIPFILSQGTIGLLTSTAEGFPLVILEYGQAALPVISTNAGFCAEIIDDGVSGLLFDPNDQKTLEDALKRMVVDCGLQRDCGHALHEKVKSNYSEEQVIGLLLSKYHKLKYGSQKF
ncbi:alpha-1,4-N-acetylgalactosamine transferase [Flavobacterium magnum]|uniref:Alpha-1,4-N-acetylgalactosamine transferase n=1 Tax=Flavobacterium magnum TaxID=2162713 RepID=A0A2S0RDU1_9FLAO|nr:glycosyltransferase [Flavobacterium magnum]AWA29794.1 alpha-1,4-N-acetylgalactosamine transferase [Flavobacterium magnum]